jgi:hypothetical protein
MVMCALFEDCKGNAQVGKGGDESGKCYFHSMKISPFPLMLLLCWSVQLYAQVSIPPHRQTAWHLAGAPASLNAPTNEVLLTDFGNVLEDGATADAALTAAIASFGGGAGTVVFPEGHVVFQSTVTLPDSIFLRGAEGGSMLRFELPAQADLIRVTGAMSPTPMPLAQAAERGETSIVLEDASGIAAGDVVRLRMDDEDLVFSSWAHGTVGQVVEVLAVEGNELTLADPLNTWYPMERSPRIHRMEPVRAVGLECLRIWNMADGHVQGANVLFHNAFNCVVRNVKSKRADFAHVNIRSSAHVTVEGCQMWNAVGHGNGGQGYGVMVQEAASFCRVENSVFELLRHSMIAQSGANGNVFAYNYSFDPYWTDVSLPANSAGDLVMHGNYPYMNLAEGNTVQHMVVDASHGNNGPMNTFFRNRAQLYGFFSDAGTPSDSMNVIGNELTNTGMFMGNFMLNGNGHLSHGNNRTGTVIPAGTEFIGLESFLYADGSLPAYMNDVLPMVGLPLALNANMTPAQVRFLAGMPIVCGEEIVTVIEEALPSEADFPRMMADVLHVPDAWLPATVTVIGMDGRVHVRMRTDAVRQRFDLPAGGIYAVTVTDGAGKAHVLRAVW